jgi:PAS domain S-box-containing protein
MVGTVQDVTDRVLAERNLGESELRFRELANNIDQMVWTCDEAGNANWNSDRWYVYTGTQFEQMRGEGWTSVLDPHHLERVVENFRGCVAAARP